VCPNPLRSEVCACICRVSCGWRWCTLVGVTASDRTPKSYWACGFPSDPVRLHPLGTGQILDGLPVFRRTEARTT